MRSLLSRLERKWMCQIACHGTTATQRDERTGARYAVVYCKRCRRILEVEEVPFPATRGNARRAA